MVVGSVVKLIIFVIGRVRLLLSMIMVVVLRFVFVDMLVRFGLVSGLWKMFCMIVFEIVSVVLISKFMMICGRWMDLIISRLCGEIVFGFVIFS